MNIFAFSGLLTGLTCIAMSILVLIKSTGNSFNRLWAMFCVAVAIWGFGGFFIGLEKSHDQALIFWKLTYLGVTFIPPLSYHFVVSFISFHKKRERTLIYIIGIFFFILSPTPLMTAGVTKRFNQFYYLYPGVVYYLFFLYFSIVVFIIHLYLWQFMNRTQDLRKKTQVGWFFLASAIGFAGGLLCFLPVFGIEIYPYGNFAVALYPLIMTYAIIKHELFDIRIVIRKAVFYSVLTILVSIVYVTIVTLFHVFYSNESFVSLTLFEKFNGFRLSDYLKITPYFYSLGLTTICSFALSIFVLLKNRDNKANILWSLGSFFCGIWSLFFNLLIHSKNLDIALFSAQINGVAAGFTCILLAHFCKEFASYKPKNNFFIIIGYINAFIFLIFAFSKYFVYVRPVLNFTYYTQAKPLYAYFTAHFFFYLFYGHWCLAKSLKNHNQPKKNQIKYIILALSLGYLTGATTFLPVYGVSIEPFPAHFVWFYAAIITYAMVKHELLDIQIIIRKAALFTLFTIFLSFLSLALILIMHSLIANEKSPLSAFIANFIGVFFIAVMFKPFELFFQKKLEKRFFKGTVSEIAEQNEKLAFELERTERLKSVGILAAGMAHEIKNPLTAIRTFSEYLPKKFDDPVFREKFTRIINEETSRIERIIKDLLVFSKPSQPKKQICNFENILRNTTRLLSEDLLKKNIKVEYEINTKDLDVYVDPMQIKQAILNIILNAIDSMKEAGGVLKFTISCTQAMLQVDISDTGPGIPPNMLKHLFDPFYTTKDEGTGLGLAITLTLLEANGAKIAAQNNPSGGASFTLALPTTPLK